MGDRTSVTTDAAGRRVVAKVAGDAQEALRLENEAAMLEAGRHPGIAELVGFEGHGVGAVLLTTHVGGTSLAQVGALPIEEAAGLLAALATTLADLHDLGLVHGAVAPDHVLIGPDGRPVVCSLGYGGRVGERARSVPPVPPAFLDPARTDGDALTPAVDVFGLGALARFLAPSPPAGHAMEEVAAGATCDDAVARPTARVVAGTLQAAVPGARLPRGLAPRPPTADRSAPPLADPLEAWRWERGGAGRGGVTGRRPSPRVLAGVAAVIAVGVALLLTFRPPAQAPSLSTEHSQDAPDPPQGLLDEAQPGPPSTRVGLASSATTVPMATTATATASGPSAAASSGRRSDCQAVTAVLQADADGDGCPDAMRYADGILESGGTRWSLGQVGDQVATGDWGCQGLRTVALYRPSTGEIFRFDGWASAGRDARATAVARVDGGQLLRAADVDRDGCHEAVVERSAGLPAEVIRLPRAAP